MATNNVANEPQPDEMPDVYASTWQGDCLEPTFADGACLVFSKLEAPENGDFVGIWLHPDATAPGELLRRVKRLVTGAPPGMSFPLAFAPGSTLEPIVQLEQFNPPKLFQVRGSHVLAMHKVIGEAVPLGDGTAVMKGISA